MPIKLTADQIPLLWEHIKYSVVNVNRIEEKYRGRYLSRLLYLLLSDKAQCFVELDEHRRVEKLMVTKMINDEVTDSKTLFIIALYAFIGNPNSNWQYYSKWFRDFARSRGCKTITTWTYDDKVSRVCERVGMRNRLNSYIMEV